MSKDTIFENYKYVHLDRKDGRYNLIDTEKTLNIFIEDGSIKDADVIIEITEDNVQVAQLIHKIILN